MECDLIVEEYIKHEDVLKTKISFKDLIQVFILYVYSGTFHNYKKRSSC